MAIDVTLEYSTTSYGGRTNTTVSKPTNTSDSDFLLAGFVIDSDTTVTAPSGWTEITTLDCAAVAYNLKVYYKRASSEPSSWTWTHSYAGTCAFVKRLTGVVASGDPEDCTRSTADPGYVAGPVTAPSITTTTDGAALMQISSLYYAYGFTGSGDDLTQRINDTLIALNSDLQSSAGASGTKDVNFTSGDRPLTILIALTPAGGGSNYEVTATDGISFSETIQTNIEFNLNVIDGLSIGESESSLFNFLLSISDGFVASDNSTTTVSMNLSLSDSAVISDLSNRSLQLNTNCLDGILSSDGTTNSLHITILLTDGAKLSDSMLSNLSLSNLLTDGFFLTDTASVSTNALYAVVATDGIKLSETLNNIANVFGISSDGIKLSENIYNNMSIQSTAIDGITLSDTILSVLFILASCSDGVKLSEISLEDLITGILLTASDSFNMSDSISTLVSAIKQISDRTIFSDNASPIGIIRFILSDGIRLNDISVKSLLATLSIIDSIKLSDTNTVNANFTVTCSDGAKFNSIILSILSLFTNAIDIFNLSDETSISISTRYTVSGSVSITITTAKSTITVLVKKPAITQLATKPSITVS